MSRDQDDILFGPTFSPEDISFISRIKLKSLSVLMCMSAEWGRPMANGPRLFHLTVTLNRTKWILKGNELMFAVDWKVKISLTCDCTAATEPVEMFQVDPPSGYSLWWGLILSLSEIRMSTPAPVANKGV